MSFGGSANCPVCGKAVYHMEQVIGPGRKIYHKVCLKCQQCGKRLDQGSVVEHDLLPYCSRCHTQLFGTRDLRHANVHAADTSPLRTPRTPAAPSPPNSPRPLPRPPTASTEFYTPPRLDNPRSIPNDQPASTPDANTPITRPDFRSSRPISVPFAGGTKALDERGLLRRAESPRSKVGEKITGEDACEGCGKKVYAAEQVNAIGAKWHRWCLKCSTCKSTVDASKVSDKDGQIYCKNCYAKNFGPGGILGKR